ncbi:DUF3238 domain-containing protein [Phenylobacterium sp. LjRoot225]|uniref:papain-like cysteine protease family protein n=1 Tax=Phenylobacterium sp. LjRoot225 TaxID=3342285 RepID=UPI003ECE7714
MVAQIRPNRLDVNDRFPMLGFTIRADGPPQRAEVALATDPALFRADGKAKRTASNFYSSRASGPLSIPRGEAVYVVPPEVLGRFIGAERLYFGLATAPAANGAAYQVASVPTDASPYVSLRDLTERSMRRVRILPSRQRTNGYGDNGHAGMDWAGDAAAPGAEPVKAANGANGSAPKQGGAAVEPAPYDDGFGPMPPPPNAPAATPAVAQGAEDDAGMQIGAERVTLAPLPVYTLPEGQQLALKTALTIGLAPLGPLASLIPEIARATGCSIGVGPAVSGGLVHGYGLGVGVIFGPNGELGFYGSAEFEVGVLASLSATCQITVMRGGLEGFSGAGKAAALSYNYKGAVVGGAALFDANDHFHGVMIQAGLGVELIHGLPDIYAALERRTAVQVAPAQGLGRGGWSRQPYGASRALDSGGIQIQVAPDRVPVTPPPVKLLDDWQRTLLLGGLMALPAPIGPLITGFKLGAQAAGVSIGFGPAAGGGFFGGAGVGCGLIFGPAGELGAYGQWEVDVGFLASLSAVMQVTVVKGGVEAFNGWSTAAAISGGEGVVGGGAALFNERGEFQGVSVQAGAGVGLSPVDIYLAAQQSKSVQLGLAQGLGRTPRRGVWSKGLVGARGLDADPLAVDVKYRMFIPSPLIDSPFAVYGGDGRDFAYDGGSSRGEIHATVRLTPGGGVAGIDLIGRDWGRSTAYATSDSYHPEGKPDWWLEKVDGAQPTEWKKLEASDDNLKIEVGASSRRSLQTMFENSSVVTISAAGALPLSTTAPDIDATMSIFLRINGGAVEAKVDGSHDGFPCHELYVNGKRLYAYDPVAAGAGPTSLMPPEDITAITDWVVVATIGASAQALSGDAFSINWDDVELIPQTSDLGCWAAAAAMVVGWRDHMSVSPSSIADMCSRSGLNGLDFGKEKEFAKSIGLVAENPACYTADGFRGLLESFGPLWVGSAVPSPHIRVVTGMYSDGLDTYVRITDPWDRVVGAPGKPGPALATHETGSRYIMRYEDFTQEYETAGMQVPPGTLQILHSAGVLLRMPNRGDAKGAGYAQGLARAFEAPLLAGLEFAGSAWNAIPPKGLNYETDSSLPAAEKLEVWRRRLELLVGGPTAQKLGDLPAVARDRGWTIAVGAGATPGVALVSAIGSGLTIDPDGQPKTFGVGRLDGGAPLDPVEPKAMAAVTNGRPQITIIEGDSGAFMRWGQAVAFRASDRRIRNGAALLAPNGAFAGATFELLVNGLKAEDVFDAIKVGYAQAPARSGDFTMPLDPAVAQGASRSFAVRAFNEDPGPAPGTTLTRRQKDVGGVRFDLAQMKGLVPPQAQPAIAVGAPLPGKRVVLNDWPYLDGPSGRTHGDVQIDWSYAAGAVGEVITDVADAAAFDGVLLSVATSIAPASLPAPEPTVAAVTVTTRFVFCRAGQPDEVAITEVTLFGDGREPQRVNRQEKPVPALGR